MKEIGSEFSLYSRNDYYFRRIKSLGKSVRFLRCGRDAIGYVADLLSKESGIVLMPAYCCDSMVNPFIIRGWKIIYYPINEDLSVDFENLISIAENYTPDIILLMNFFGIAETSDTIRLIRDKWSDITIIEDITHSLFDLEEIYSDQVDYYIGSIRKWFGIPDGALVISNRNFESEIKYYETDFVTLRSQGLSLKEEYNHTNDPDTKFIFRKMLSDAEVSLDNGRYPCSISYESQYILDNMNVETLRNNRKLNAKVLLNCLSTVPKVKFPKGIENILKTTPFSIPILVENRTFIQNELASNGIYCSLLWPLSEEARKMSPFAKMMESSMLSIPIDQRYDASDMNIIYNAISNLLKK